MRLFLRAAFTFVDLLAFAYISVRLFDRLRVVRPSNHRTRNGLGCAGSGGYSECSTSVNQEYWLGLSFNVTVL